MFQGVGKSCLVLRYVRNHFDPASKITVSHGQACMGGRQHPTASNNTDNTRHCLLSEGMVAPNSSGRAAGVHARSKA